MRFFKKPSKEDKKKAAQKKFKRFLEKRKCRFCEEKIRGIDYKDILTLQKNLNPQGSMFSRKRSGLCSRHQKLFQVAVKRARFIALLPYTA